MFKKKLTHKKIIKKAEKLFYYFKLLKSTTEKKYPLLEEEDIVNKQILLKKLDDLIEILKASTKKYISDEISLDEFDKKLNNINNLYNKLRLENPILNAIIYGYLTPSIQAITGTPVPDAYTFVSLFENLKNSD